MKVTITVEVGQTRLTSTLPATIENSIEAEARATGHGAMSIIVDALQRAMARGPESDLQLLKDARRVADEWGHGGPALDELIDIIEDGLPTFLNENADDEGLLPAVREAIG